MSESLATIPANLQEFAAQNGMTPQEALEIFTDPDAAKRIQEITRWRARVAFHGGGVQTLIDIAQGDDKKAAITAIVTLGKLAGEFKAPRPVTVTFEELLKKAAASTGPLNGITQIVDAAIDAEDDDDGDDTDE